MRDVKADVQTVFRLVAILILTVVPGRAHSTNPPARQVSSIPAESRQLSEMLPLLDAFLSGDDEFTRTLTTRLSLSAKQLARLRVIARERTMLLQSVGERAQGDFDAATMTTADRAWKEIVRLIGEERGKRMFEFVLYRWQTGPVGIAETILP
ncbi:MAG TPA: hypothetical protein VNQ79_15765 [Blastocatellia bacterium]|nr:hypothetical protein [Blastocatellia bacterium]